MVLILLDSEGSGIKPGALQGSELPQRPLDKHRRSNGRLEHLRGSSLGFRNLTNYIARSLLETGGFRPRLHPEIG
ncbi:hypothetical protein [Nocardioides deserti]|uniref:Transposase n=1 Tax=Nocardioides deserti TaxID=1588644 RepID=A0ABR6UD72_9ACTN|nr:hypothetical protein [Nocardioides deserti]MBC2962315.1 hypothetical protein [Nocardioides deserti]GGO79151.1 hypothetical protein GCM10012276_38230 [Nocardioides deserti]